MGMGKFAIQRFWLDRATLADVMAAYGLHGGHPLYERISKVLSKSKRDFKNGWSYFTREDVDRKVAALCMKG